jgi:hypothetical protein
MRVELWRVLMNCDLILRSGLLVASRRMATRAAQQHICLMPESALAIEPRHPSSSEHPMRSQTDKAEAFVALHTRQGAFVIPDSG